MAREGLAGRGDLTALVFGPATVCFLAHAVLAVGRLGRRYKTILEQLTIK
jgi:hypothetical protein